MKRGRIVAAMALTAIALTACGTSGTVTTASTTTPWSYTEIMHGTFTDVQDAEAGHLPPCAAVESSFWVTVTSESTGDPVSADVRWTGNASLANSGLSWSCTGAWSLRVGVSGTYKFTVTGVAGHASLGGGYEGQSVNLTDATQTLTGVLAQ